MLSTIYGIQGIMTRVVGTWIFSHPGHPGIESGAGHDAAHVVIACAVLGPLVLVLGAWFLDRARNRR